MVGEDHELVASRHGGAERLAAKQTRCELVGAWEDDARSAEQPMVEDDASLTVRHLECRVGQHPRSEEVVELVGCAEVGLVRIDPEGLQLIAAHDSTHSVTFSEEDGAEAMAETEDGAGVTRLSRYGS